MTAEDAKAALVFLGRSDLKGHEYPALHKVVMALENFIRQAEQPMKALSPANGEKTHMEGSGA